MAVKAKTEARRTGSRRQDERRHQTPARSSHRPGAAGRSCRLPTRRPRKRGGDRTRGGGSPRARNQRHRHPHRARHRPQRAAGDGDHRRQRQHAVPVRFRARRNHRKRRRADACHPSGGRRSGTASPAFREILADDAPGSDPDADRVSVIQVHVGRFRQDQAEGLKERLGKMLGQVRAAVKRLEADAGPPRPGDLRFPLRAGAARQGGRHRSDRLPRMAARRQFHLPRHARVPLFRRRRQRHARPQPTSPASASSPIPTCWCCGAATRR